MNETTSTNGTTPKPDALHVAFVLDRSGSMGHLARAVPSGFDEYLDTLPSDSALTLFATAGRTEIDDRDGPSDA